MAGIQIEPGKFLDPAQSFFLQYQVNNEAGTIDYALDDSGGPDDWSFPGGLTVPRYILIVALAGLAGVGLVGSWFWFGRR